MNISCPWLPGLSMSRPNQEEMKSFLELVMSGMAVLLDVRTQDEWNEARLRKAQLFEFEKIKSGLVPNIDPNLPVLIYCASGARAEMSKIILGNKGFSKIVNLGGIHELVRFGFELE